MQTIKKALCVATFTALALAWLSPLTAQSPSRGKILSVNANTAFSTLPLTVEVRAKLDAKENYNVLIANEEKTSPTHWELFTFPQTGFLAVYVPGFQPSQPRTSKNIADGQWHDIAMTLDAKQVRLFVDGVLAVQAKVQAPNQAGVPGPLTIGSLPGGHLACRGKISDVRISKTIRDLAAKKLAFVADASTIGLWRFEGAKGWSQEVDPPAKTAVKVVTPPEPYDAPTLRSEAGYTFTPLPAAPDTAEPRTRLAGLAAKLGLATINVEALRDGVLEGWLHDEAYYGKIDYEQQARGLMYKDTFANPQRLRDETFDPQSLILPSDLGPAGTVLRRTQAMIDSFAETLAGTDAAGSIAAAVADFQKLQAAFAAAKPAPSSPEHQAFYLAACALRRQIALQNPALDFDTILCVGHASRAGSVRSTPIHNDAIGGHMSTQYFGTTTLPIGGLYLVKNYKSQPQIVNLLENSVVQNGPLKGQKLEGGSFATPDLSFDAKTVLFAWCQSPDGVWIRSQSRVFHIFRVNIDGSNLTQLTFGDTNDIDPCFLPGGRVAFISERRGGYIRCFGYPLVVPNYTLFSMKDDGSDIVPLSYYETSEWNPSVTNDGRIVFTRWDYTDRENCLGTRLWFCGPDGVDPRAPHGNYPFPWHNFPDPTIFGGQREDSRMGAPVVEAGIRAIPNSHKYVATGAPHHGEFYGSLIVIDPQVADDHHMSQVKRLTPDEPFPEFELDVRRQSKYGQPWPLSEDYYLANRWENLILLDRWGNQELLCESRLLGNPDDRLRLSDPIPVKARPCPPVLPPRTRQGENADPAARATLSVMNVYETDQRFPEGTKIKYLRVIQNILKTNHTMGVPMIGYQNENTPRIPLGIVPVEEDGSAYFEAPVAKELIFQVLDENHQAVQTMRSSAFVHPGEQLSCLGCHESPQKVPSISGMPKAMQRAPSQLQPEIGPVEPISYYRQIQPILQSKCLPCHQRSDTAPKDLSYAAMEKYLYYFKGGMLRTSMYNGVGGGSRSIPGHVGAKGSRLSSILANATHAQGVSDEERRIFTVWMDCNVPQLGSYVRVGAQRAGKLVWPTLDVDPANVLGVEGRGAVLEKNFWHENAAVAGPHVFLGTSHKRNQIYLMNRKQEILWQCDVQNPQDVWMLPSGNILVASLHGVKEITRDKQVVWEYAVEAPNETPTCQPLPDGNVLVGVVGLCQLLEVNRKGEVVHRLQLSTPIQRPHQQFRMCRKTPQGTYLVPFTDEGAVREYDREGKVIRSFPPMRFPVCAVRLEDGHTLISADRGVREYDADGFLVWQITPDNVPDIDVAIPAGIQRLPNGHTVVCNWGSETRDGKAAAHIFEVDEEKRIVWQVTSPLLGNVAQCQLLTDDGQARKDEIAR